VPRSVAARWQEFGFPGKAPEISVFEDAAFPPRME